MLFDIEVRHNPGNGDYFQPYTEVGVKALTAQDAVAKIQRQNPGCQVWCSDSYNESSNNSSSSGDGSDVLGYLLLAAIIGGIYVFVTWWYYVIPGALILGILYYWMQRNHEE